MRLESYLTEIKTKNYVSPKDEKLFEQMKKECSDIIKIYKKTGQFLYRGVKNPSGGIMVKTDHSGGYRKPIDTPAMVHRMLNRLFHEKFGWYVRNGVGVTTRVGQSLYYGKPHIFLPVNGYEFAFSDKYTDLYNDAIRKLVYGSKPDKEWVEKHKRSFQALVNKYQNTKLKDAFTKNVGEVYFKTDKYYLVDYDFYQEYLRKKWRIKE